MPQLIRTEDTSKVEGRGVLLEVNQVYSRISEKIGRRLAIRAAKVGPKPTVLFEQ
jgi:hypothetical protein